jgi:hypothetical protein
MDFYSAQLRRTMKTLAIVFLTLTCLLGLTHTAHSEDALNNSVVIDMKQMGLGDGVIVEKIKTSTCNFDTSLAGLKQLKAAGVSDAVITAMLSTHGPTAAPAAATASAAPAAVHSTDPNDPAAPHEAGIWLYDETGGKRKMTQLEPSVYSQGRSGSMVFMGWGATVKQQAVIRSSHAVMSTTNRSPAFYFYFEHTEAGLSDSHGATSPNEYILAQFEVADKDNQRRLVIGSMNAYAGGTSGADAQSVRSFGFDKISPGVYKVTTKDSLTNGEYGFFYGGTSTGGYGIFAPNATGGKVFDFGVNGTPDAEPKPVMTDTNKPETKKHFPWFKKKATDTNQPASATN